MTLSKLRPEHRAIATKCAKAFGTDLPALLSPLRGRPRESEARQVLYYFLHERCLLSYTEVGELLNRYRKTVSWGVEQTKMRMKNKEFASKVLAISQKL